MAFKSRFRAPVFAVGIVLMIRSAALPAQDLAASPQSDPLPGTLAEPLKALIAPDGVRVAASAVTLDFWWVKALPLNGGTGALAWSQVSEGTFVGVVRLSAPWPDIRGRTIQAGLYTLRYGIQPANGDHLGVSPFRDFLLLSPVSLDKDPAPISHDPLAELSGKSVGSTHPAAWSLDPPVAAEQPLQTRANEAGHKAVIFQVPGARDGTVAGALRFGLILIGKIEA